MMLAHMYSVTCVGNRLFFSFVCFEHVVNHYNYNNYLGCLDIFDINFVGVTDFQ